ncbi:L-rhamnose mutarotase [Deinococcus sp.]|uniref:L-rhamnose mutarotase n=1 Tax=Deinococcus sp. TaxID=47478 RepID=UPI003C7CD9C7
MTLPLPKTVPPTTMRLAQCIRLKPGALAEYRALHDAVWPEVRAALSAAHIHRYSISLLQDERGDTLFATLDYSGQDWEADQVRLAAAPRLREWAERAIALQESWPQGAPGEWRTLTEVFFHV